MALKFGTIVEKELKLKVRKIWGRANSYICRSYIAKTGRGLCPSLILNRVKTKQAQEARVNQFPFHSFQNNQIFEISKMLKNNR